MTTKASRLFYNILLLAVATGALVYTISLYRNNGTDEKDVKIEKKVPAKTKSASRTVNKTTPARHTANDGRPVSLGGSEIVVDTKKTGALLRWQSHGRVWVENAPSPFSITLADGTKAEFVAEGADENTEGSMTVRGHVGSFPARVTYTLNADGTDLQVALKLDSSAGIESWDCSFPLTLDRHKKIYFQGDHHLPWESRFTYQFHISTSDTLLASPDFNKWRWFAAEQLSSDAFRIWKAESDTTSPLVMQEGTRMPPYVQVYDEQGGVTVEYPQMAEGGRRALIVDALDHGTVQVTIQAPQPEHAPATPSLDAEQVIHLYANATEESLREKRAALNAAFTPSAPVETELLEAPWLRETPLADGIQYVTGGLPFAQGALRDASALSVQVAGTPVPLQTRPLGFWPDGSLKWVLCTLPFTNAKASENDSAPRVTLRNGESLPVTMGTANASPAPTQQVEARTLSDGHVEVRNGSMTLRFNLGKEWLSGSLNKAPLFTAPPKAYVRFRRDVETHRPFALRLQGGVEQEEIFEVKSVKLEEQGPLRAVVRLEGEVADWETTRIILRATLYAGRPEIVFTHTAEFRFKDPRTTFLTGMGLEFPLAGLGAEEKGIVQESHDFQWTYGNAEPNPGGWLSASLDNGVRFLGGIRHAALMAPKAMTQKDHVIRYELWPENVAPMDVRRYSNRTHQAQGESTGDGVDWVEKNYYAESPFAGISRTHELYVGFWPERQAPGINTLAADFESPPLLYPGWDACVQAKVVLPASTAEGWPKVWQARDHFTRFWLYHRNLHHWYGFWNFGDFRHRFREGYGWVTTSDALAKALADPERKLPPDAPRLWDYVPANDWAYDNGRWGWSNSEGLANLFLQQEYLRTGNRAIYSAAEAMARYCRDVVTRHDPPLLGRGTRHGVQPWSDGNHEERQTTITEYRLHYFLSGDPRSLDVITRLYKEFYSKSPVSDEAEHSARLGALLFHHELTASPDEARQLQRYASFFIAPDGAGLYLNPLLQFPGPQPNGAPQSLNAKRMFFACYGGMHALLEYQQIFDDESLKDGLIAMARAVIAQPLEQPSELIYIAPVVAFAAKHAPDPKPFQQYLVAAFRGARFWPSLYQSVTGNPAHWSGPTGLLHGNMPGCFFWANWVPYLTSAFPKDVVWTREMEEPMKTLETQGYDWGRLPEPWRQKEYDALVSPDGHYITPSK